MKRILATVFCFLTAVCVRAEQYKIIETVYDIKGNVLENVFGKTREYPLSQAVLIDYTTVFDSPEQFDAYLKNITQQFVNQRVLAHAEVAPAYGTPDENGIIPVTLSVSTRDTWNIFPLPYPKYNSNEGLNLKLKVKDYNFFGTMHTLNFDINYNHEKFPTEDRPDQKSLGINCDFEIPFKIGKINTLWSTSLGASYIFSENIIDFSLGSSIDFTYPMKHLDITVGVSQTVTKDSYYADTDDDFYFTEEFYLEVPVKVYEIENWAWIKWTPYVSYKWNCKDLFWGSENETYMTHEDLIGPVLTGGHKLTTGRVNWHGNFRKGLDVSIKNYIVRNKGKETTSPGISGELESYVSWKYAAVNTRLFAFYNKNETETVGSRMRGIIDKSYKTNVAVALNIDIPVHIFTTNFLKVLDFELQLSPFIDVSLGKNPDTGSKFNYKDGYYTGGVEALFYPTKMRSIQGRISFGYDLTSFMPGSLVNKDWRSNTKYELFIGIGLFY